MQIKVPYGKEILLVEVPNAEIVQLNEVEIKDEKKIIESSLQNPINSLPFEKFLQNSNEVLFIVNDATRPTPTEKILEIIYDKFKGKNFKFIIANGSHRKQREEEFKQIFGKFYEEFKGKIHEHDAKDNSSLVYVGKTKRGTEFFINKIIGEAEKIININSVEPHYFAGYTGGRKSFIPGIAGYKTIEQNHKFALDMNSQTLALRGNPVHEDMEDCVKMIKKDIFSINLVLNKEHKIYSCHCGDIFDSFYSAIKKVEDIFCVKIKEKADIVVSITSYPMDIDLYQSQKALDNGKLALKENGIIILVSKCRMGTGNKEFIELMSSCKTPKEALVKIEKEYKLGYHKASKMAEICLWANIYCVSSLEDEIVKSVFMTPFKNDLQNALNTALKIKGENTKVLFLMNGSLTVPKVG